MANKQLHREEEWFNILQNILSVHHLILTGEPGLPEDPGRPWRVDGTTQSKEAKM